MPRIHWVDRGTGTPKDRDDVTSITVTSSLSLGVPVPLPSASRLLLYTRMFASYGWREEQGI